MNRHIARALLQDALYQVLDDKVFRILVVVTFLLVLPAWLVAFGDQEISVLFGWKTVSYGDMVSGFRAGSGSLAGVKDLKLVVIQSLQQVFTQQLAGNLGILFCIAATAFFTPRMLEKGAADTLFSKPVSRPILFLARYVSGVVFVAILAAFLVGGIYMGLLVRSGHGDVGFLWSVVTLVYVFALIHAVSVTVATFTKSSVAAILCTLVFFAFNGCIHQIWVQKEHGRAVEAERAARASAGDDEPTPKERNSIVKFLTLTLDAFHFILPKTTDGDVITRKADRALSRPEFVFTDPAGKLRIVDDPKGFTPIRNASSGDLALQPIAWRLANSETDPSLTLSRRSRLEASGDKPRKQSARQFAEEFQKSLEGRAEIAVKPTRERRAGPGIAFEVVRWRTSAGATKPVAEHECLHVCWTIEDSLYELDGKLPASGSDAAAEVESVLDFLDGVRPARDGADTLRADEWYEKTMALDAPPRFNILVSIGSSVLFAALLIALALWRLRRIDF